VDGHPQEEVAAGADHHGAVEAEDGEDHHEVVAGADGEEVADVVDQDPTKRLNNILFFAPPFFAFFYSFLCDTDFTSYFCRFFFCWRNSITTFVSISTPTCL